MPTKTPAKILEITPKGSHNYNSDMTYYYVVTYEEDILYAKDHIHYYNIWTRMDEEWGELPKRIERVDCGEIEYRDIFGIKETSMRGMVAEG